MDQKGRHWQEGRCKDSKSTSSSRWTPLEDPEAQIGLRWASFNMMKHKGILETSQHQNYHWLDQHPIPQFVIQILTTMFKMSNIFFLPFSTFLCQLCCKSSSLGTFHPFNCYKMGCTFELLAQSLCLMCITLQFSSTFRISIIWWGWQKEVGQIRSCPKVFTLCWCWGNDYLVSMTSWS